ncbi:LRRN4 C-terminal-like protein [Coregonus clupeaformis]|uniref:LRRN4 C-terminal-like protein n=1 Tax=Coregonus clupeaformis TaxID=59861 RepID=UPI001E1C3E88|nr:LRRN4 C-terminal-like protein [Coregonus clupeaformis]XP_041750094.2 LRRN4 C-terminal-like protein [Coregonus clupeaformis]
MSANKDCPPPLIILLLALLNGSSSFAVPSDVSGTNHTATLPLRPRGHMYNQLEFSDYYDEFTDPPSQPPPAPSQATNPQPCDYDPCRELQPPCAQLAASSGCLCPGVSGPHVAPEAPYLKRLSMEDAAVVVQWCAPLSFVTHYEVVVGALEPLVFGEDQRSGTVKEVGQGAEVCVVAVNNAGVSKRQRGSCTMYEPPGDSSVALKAGLIGGALGLLLLLSLAFLLWRHRARRKADARITQATDETL